MVLLLLTFCLLLLPLWESVIVPCFVIRYVHSSIAIILMGKLELVALLNMSSWCLVMVYVSFSWCHGVVCGLRLWYFLIILTYYFFSIILASCLTAIKNHVIKDCITVYERNGKNEFLSIKNSDEILNKLKSRGFLASSLSTYDFSTFYTTLSHNLIKEKLT